MNWAIEFASLHVPSDGTAKVFGVVVYTRAHANIKQALDNKDYWSAFHEVSGPRWHVLAIRAEPGYNEYPDFKPGLTGLMVAVWNEPNANKELLRDFGLKSTKDLPCLVLFAPMDSGEIAATAIKLSDASVDEAYTSIKEAISVVTQSLDKVLDEYLLEEGAYKAVEVAILNHNSWRKIKAVGRVLERIVNAVP